VTCWVGRTCNVLHAANVCTQERNLVSRPSRKFRLSLDELISEEHVCRVIEAFVGGLDMAKLGVVRPEPAETGRPGYDPRDLREAVSVRVAVADSVLWPVGNRVRAQRGGDVVARPTGSRP